MPSCDYCGREFQDEEAYLDHLADSHEGELDRIDRRRVEEHASADGSGASVTVIAAVAGVVLLLAVAGGAYVFLSGGGGDGGASGQGMPAIQQRPSALGSVHSHGTILVRIDGRTLDFSHPDYQLRDDYFHFEGGNGRRWHVHARGVTLQYAMATLGVGVERNRVYFDGRSYRRTHGNTSLTITANGRPVNPATYVLQDGDEIRVVVNVSD